MVTGNCLCGTVRWRAEGPFRSMVNCHCTICRKAHGAAFATYVGAPIETFSWTSGADAIQHYQSSPGFGRAFCGECGSVVPEHQGGADIYMPAGCLNEDPGVRPGAHIFAPSCASWKPITDDLPQYDTYPGAADDAAVARPELTPATEGILRGSCLCGDVAYEVSSPIKVVHNCHCSRCRKARAAAHATNGFTSIDGVKFGRGEDKLKTYFLPSAKYFTQVFCSRCGAGMPRLDSDRGIAVIPLASLDDDPGRGTDDHVFTASKADWDTITDDLPQFETFPG